MLLGFAWNVLMLVILPTAINSAMTTSEFKEFLKFQSTLELKAIGVKGEYSDMIHFYDTVIRNHNNSQSLCRNFDDKADLVIIQNRLHYTQIRIDYGIPAGTYWINGREELTDKKFNVTSACEIDQDLTGIEVRSPTSTALCLALVKGASLSNTYLQVLPCTNNYRPLCAFKLNC